MSLRKAKLAALASLDSAGISGAFSRSTWRRRRLLILCYHGISTDDEHLWRPRLYLTPDRLRERLTQIRDGGYTVLPLVEALSRLGNETLPGRSVVLTFDDGGYDFQAHAVPILKEFGFPATVYLSTYYCLNQAPIFPLMCNYLLWKTEKIGLATDRLTGETLEANFTADGGRAGVFWELLRHADTNGLDDRGKQALLARLADELALDYQSLLDRRVLHLMHPDEVAALAAVGIDVQMHTHRHRSPSIQQEYRDELRLNRELITHMTGRLPRHFCYPSGAARPEFTSVLRREGVRSATTCRAAFVSRDDDRLRLSRLLDHSNLAAVEFKSWLSGTGHFATRRGDTTTIGANSPSAEIAFLERGSAQGVRLASARE